MFSFSDILSIFYFGALVQLLILVAVLCFPRENRRLSREPRASKQARNDETGADPAPQLLLVPHLTCYFISMSSIQLVFCPGAVPRLFWSPDFSRPASVNFPKFRRAWAHVKIQTLYICVVDIVKQNLESWTGGDIYVYVYAFVFFFFFFYPTRYIYIIFFSSTTGEHVHTSPVHMPRVGQTGSRDDTGGSIVWTRSRAV